jgi:mono/diheme cytochrome c family protein
MFKDYCAACHGVDGKGNGPAVVFLKAPPPDLCTMAQRNKEKYPAEKVVYMLNFGSGSQAHGALDMPTWGPLFRSLDTEPRLNVAELPVHNLTDLSSRFRREVSTSKDIFAMYYKLAAREHPTGTRSLPHS